MVNVNVGGIYANATINTSQVGPALNKINAKIAKMAAQTNLLLAKTAAVAQVAAGKIALQSAQLQKTQAQTAKTIAQTGQIATKAGKTISKGLDGATKSAGKLKTGIWNINTSFKDIGRVATGILMARAINSMLRTVMDGVRTLFNFNSILETTRISFKYLMQSNTQEVEGFIKQLEKLAAETPYTFETATTAAQRLLALGFKKEQLMPLLSTMADLNAATGGGAEQMEALAYAFGKVQAMGKMTTRELRLFVTANIPIYQILREELGLTEKDFQKLRISASDAIPAILAGIQKFKGAAEEQQKTIPGLLSSIHDYLLFLGEDIMASPFLRLKELLTDLRNRLMLATEAFKTGGLRAAIAEMLPKNMAIQFYRIFDAITLLVAKIKELWLTTLPLRQALLETFMTTLVTATTVIKYFVGIINNSIGGMAGFVRAILAFMVAKQIIIIINMLTTAVKAFYLTLVTNPIGLAVAILAGAIVYLGLSASSAAQSMYGLGGSMNAIIQKAGSLSNFINKATTGLKTLVGVGGIAEKPVSIMDLINSFADTSDAIDDVGSSAQKAAKKIKDTFLASFDEVFTIPDVMDDIADATLGIAPSGQFDFGKFNDLFGNIGAYTPGKLTPEAIQKRIPSRPRLTHDQVMGEMAKDGFSKVHKKGDLSGVVFPEDPATVDNLIKFVKQANKIINEDMASFFTGGGKETNPIYGAIRSISDAFGPGDHKMAGVYDNLNKLFSNKLISKGWDKEFVDIMNAPFTQLVDDVLAEWSPKFKKFFTEPVIGPEWLAKPLSENLKPLTDWLAKPASETFKPIYDFFTKPVVGPEWLSKPLSENFDIVKLKALNTWIDIKNWAILKWDEIKIKATEIWTSVTSWAKTKWDEVKTWAVSMWDGPTGIKARAMVMWDNILLKAKEIWNNIVIWAQDKWTIIKTGFIGVWSVVTGIVKRTWDNILNSIITTINKLIEIANSINPWKDIPTIPLTQQTVAQVGHAVPRLNGAATGGIVNKNQLINVGEKNKPETITPLTKEGVLPWAQAIVASMGGQTNTTNAEYTMVKMKTADLVNLERQLFTVRKSEGFRIAGRTA